jgi:glutathione synthase/RimK-type ligase-like ATP-grasp enzyme
MSTLKDRGLAIVSTSGDAHANIIAAKIHLRGFLCHIFETDKITTTGRSLAQWNSEKPSFVTKDTLGNEINIEELATCWWRRIAQSQADVNPKLDPVLIDVGNAASRHMFIGGVLCAFRGTFLSCPKATIAAENKLLQLTRAREQGLRTPKTIVSNSINDIVRFGENFDGTVIIKSLVPMNGKMVDAVKLKTYQLDVDEILLIPSILQEFIDGTRHVRAIIFGEIVTLVEFESEDVDWRRNVPQKMSVLQGEVVLRNQLINLCKSLNLKMGIADLKINTSNEVVFLEINPQGQFLFVEPYIDFSVADLFVDFILMN